MDDSKQTDLIGHEKRWAALARAFAKDAIPQTMLISGPPHVGKWTFARRFAQLLLCPNAPQNQDKNGLPLPCGTCRTCHQVEIETFPDWKVYRPIINSSKDERDWIVAPEGMEGASIFVDVARKFGSEAMMKPLVGPRKVMVIQGASQMTDDAQNSLLKTFEEPVKGLSIMLLCDNPNKLLPTVLSRCWHLPLGLASDAAISDWLSHRFPAAAPQQREEATRVAAGRPGAAWRELRRLERRDEEDEPISRFAQASRIVERIEQSQPVGALGLTEEALRLAREWWAQDQTEESGGRAKDLKKGDAKASRSAAARFLDELSNAYRMRWANRIEAGDEGGSWAGGLDLIRKTRHYILRNANTNLALDVLFGRLIALHR